jgi:Helix-turn-helix domain
MRRQRGRRQPRAGREGLAPRLLDVHQAAAYLNVSHVTVRDYALQGLIRVVTLPGLRPREGDRQRESLRRLLFDRPDLDRFIEEHKD